MIAGITAGGAQGTGPAGGHRYWRVHITANDGGSFMGFTEVEMRAALAGPDMTDPQGTGALPEEMASQASSAINTENAAWLAVDDSMSTGWLSDADVTSWWSYDFSLTVPASGYSPHGPVNIVQIAIRASHNDLGSSPSDFTLQWSDDNLAWTTAMTVTGQTWSALETKVFNV